MIFSISLSKIRRKLNRQQKRRYDQDLSAVIRKAKTDMQDWVSTIGEQPSKLEVVAWQAGYIAGLNRATANLDKLKRQNDASAS